MQQTDASQSDPSPEPAKYSDFPSSFNHGGNDEPATDTTIGQFSFGPTTQTTVVTTTTTTTTNFPPLIMRPPRSLHALDPKQYPLATTPTPESLRDIQFTLDGKSVVFREPDDTPDALNKLHQQSESLHATNGTMRTITYDTHRNSLGRPPSNLTPHQRPAEGSNSRPRPVSPISLPESSQPPNRILTNSRILPNPLVCRQSRPSYPGSSQLYSHMTDAGLATPETENASFIADGEQDRTRKLRCSELFGKSRSDRSSRVKFSMQEPSTRGRRFSAVSDVQSGVDVQENSEEAPMTEQKANNDPVGDTAGGAPTIRTRRMRRTLASRLMESDSSGADNISLPSPSLSPVAALNARQQETSFDSTEDIGADTDCSTQSGKALNRRQFGFGGNIEPSSTGESHALSLMDMPLMLNYFESIPDEMKTYVMYQLLRRCPKPTLHVIADAVNPALKCDFLGLLPLELSLNIVKFLDVKSMCRASQVSKKWRHIINSDEKSWKARFDVDGFVLSEGELQCAIEEGWGWQHPDPTNGCERDLRPFALKPDAESSSTSTSPLIDQSNNNSGDPSTHALPSRRLKRKATEVSSSRKLPKTKVTELGPSDSVQWLNNLVTAENPYVAANAAALAVPFPDVGLPSLRSLHLYKSLYQRHYVIHRNWMDHDAKPRHIAFRAHDRHVVTCLQFDTDKILTGSDDTNINVYDTNTGALRATLEGHEGGVWALEYHGNTLVSGSTDRSVRVWDIEAAECTQVFLGHTSTVRCLQILLPVQIGTLPDGTPEMMPKEPLIITGSRDSSLRVWKLPRPGDPKYFQSSPAQDDGTCPYFIRALRGHSHSVRAIAAHGDTMVSGSYDCTVRVWKISTGEPVYRLQGHSFKVYSVVLDHKRNRCISGSMDNMVKIWSLETGSVLYNLEGHSSLVGLLDLQCGRLVSAAADSTLRIWDPENGQCKGTLSAHTGAITCFQHDSHKVISGSDRTLKMWNVKTGQCLKDLLTDLSGVWQVRFNGRRCVAAVQRDQATYIEVLDFGASLGSVPEEYLGKRIVVDRTGQEITEVNDDLAEGGGSDD